MSIANINHFIGGQPAAGTSTPLNPSFIFLASRTKHRDAWNRNSMVKNSATGIRYMASCNPTALYASVICSAPAAYIAEWAK